MTAIKNGRNVGGRPNAAQIAAKAAEDRKRERYEAQEAARAPRVQIDQKVTMWVLIVIGALIFIATAILTADGTIGSATAARYASPAFSFLMFFATEVAVLGCLLIYYMLGSRVDDETGEPNKATRWFFASMSATTLAAAYSTYHVLDLYAYDWESIDMWVGVSIRLSTTVFFAIISKGLANVIFAKAVRMNG